jgi:hypothetical protein
MVLPDFAANHVKMAVAAPLRIWLWIFLPWLSRADVSSDPAFSKRKK